MTRCFDKQCTSACFSLESTVVVKDKGNVSIRDLRIGDMVLSNDSGAYTKFYSTGHMNEMTTVEFLSIFTELRAKPLELTKNHMVFKGSSALPVPAHAIEVGDVVRTTSGMSRVSSICKVTRKGLFNPITLSGSIVVDNIVCSTHSEEPGFEGLDAGWIYIAGHKILHWHKLAQSIHAPHRIICGKFTRCTEKRNEDGLIPFHQFLEKLERTAAVKQSTIFSASVLLVVVTVAALFVVLELLLENATITLACISFVVGYWIMSKKMKIKVKSKVV